MSLLVVRQVHAIDARHCGREYVMASLRKKFWITRCRLLIRRVQRDCLVCKMLFAAPRPQRMADLPSDRLQAGKPPFTNAGIDCFGPFYVKRGRSQEKRYCLLLTCLVTRAVHIEVLHSLDSSSFLQGFMRFVCRRGEPSIVRCDNGTNFVGGSRELTESVSDWNSKVQQHFLQRNIQWLFNPPLASHMGGAWERQIRSVRRVLNAIMRDGVVDDERLLTVMCEAEAIINGRPMTVVSSDPKDAEPLTPNHLLLLRGGRSLPPGAFTMRDVYTRRWRHAQFLADEFWRRWVSEYIGNIQHRQRWLHPERNFKIGDIVLVADEQSPRNCWPLARVTEVFSGDDGHVRSVTITTRTSSYRRPVNKICLLEGNDD